VSKKMMVGQFPRFEVAQAVPDCNGTLEECQEQPDLRMTARPLMIATLLGASVGVPYVVSHQSSRPTTVGAGAPHASSSSSWSWPASGPMASLTGVSAAAPRSVPVGQSFASTSPHLEGVRMHPVESVLRFDLTRDWVYQNWERKSTGPTDVGLLAVRVALVSGTDISSLAGSLTYFFNDQGAIEHISFRGTTGDARRLVDFLTRTYHFARVPAPTGEQVYQVGSGNQIQSELRTRPESVLSAQSPHSSVAVELELARPGSQRFLPPRTPTLQIPQSTAAPLSTDVHAKPPSSTPSLTGTETEAAITSGVKSSFDQAHYATPDEEGQLRWIRWPN
jgi:hypothetical protein